jgi:tetratricopeptide (TPR) repeat protein
MGKHLRMAVKTDQEQPTVSRLAAALDIDDSDLDLLEEFFLAATAAQGAQSALLGRKIFARLRAGASIAQALGVSDGMIEFLYARAHRWMVVGRHEKAEPIFRVLCIIDGESADFWTGFGICLKARAAWDEAVAAFNMASQKRPQWPVPHFHALELSLRREAWTKAAAELAAFDKKADSATPAVLRAEVEKYRKALELRGGGDR